MESCEEGATIQVCRVWCLVDMESFCDPSMGMVWHNFLHFGRLPLHLVSRLLGVYSNTILVVTLLHCRFVFSESLPRSILSVTPAMYDKNNSFGSSITVLLVFVEVGNSPHPQCVHCQWIP